MNAAIWVTASPHEWEWTKSDQVAMARFCCWANLTIEQQAATIAGLRARLKERCIVKLTFGSLFAGIGGFDLGFDAEWECLPAAAFGAPHIRDRAFIVAHSKQDGFNESHANSLQMDTGEAAARVQGAAKAIVAFNCGQDGSCGASPRSPRNGYFAGEKRTAIRCEWIAEPAVDRVADGVPFGMDRIGALGNSIVPQVAEWIGRNIVLAAGGTP